MMDDTEYQVHHAMFLEKSFHLDNLIIDFLPQTKTLTSRVKTLTKRVTLLLN